MPNWSADLPTKFDNTMNLNLYINHVSYIKDLRSHSRSYACPNCDKLWKHVGKLHRNGKNCKGVRYKHPGGVYHTTNTVFEELEDDGIIVPPEHHYYPY